MQGGRVSRRPMPREGPCPSSRERRKSSTARDRAGPWVSLPGRKQGAPEFSDRSARETYSIVLDTGTSTLKEKSCLPPLAPGRSSLVTPPWPQEQLPAASTWGSGWMGQEQRLRAPRGRSSEPGPGQNSPRTGSASGTRHGRGPHSLMARRTFSVFSNSPERSCQASKPEPLLAPPPSLPASLPEAKPVISPMSSLRQVCTPSTSWRPPRPPVESRRQEHYETSTEATSSSAGSGRHSPSQFSDYLEPASQSTEKWNRQASVAPSEASTARPESEVRGSSRCSDPGPMRSILRTAQLTAGRSQSQQSKRVSFSVDCKPAPPSSMRDLLLSCKSPSQSDDNLGEAFAADGG
eukprot:TRINITY_DN12730_c0_g1_i2.p1 TRINITY_DN12730_c0_g1~~TRINITY_DN12730_c0_g1_i2.p1  ORF type:complete len:350 (-),score=26.76 TRINITY_DN12730_c0_g1_i2:78-1127(-)